MGLLARFFQRIGLSNAAWFGEFQAMIQAAAAKVNMGGMTVWQKLDWLGSFAMGWAFLHANDIGKYDWRELGGWEPIAHVKHGIKKVSGIEPVSLTSDGFVDWMGKYSAVSLNNAFGINVTSLKTQADFTTLINQMVDEAVKDLTGDEMAQYKIVDYDMANGLRRQVANVVQRGRGLAGRGGFTLLPVDRSQMLNKLRQQRFRKKHRAGLFYDNFFTDPTIDNIIITLRNNLDALHGTTPPPPLV